LGISRLLELRRRLESYNLEACLLSQCENLRYLSGFTGSSGWLLVSSNKILLAVDSRYTEQAKIEAPEIEIVCVKGDITNWLPQIIQGLSCKIVGFEADILSYNLHQKVYTALVNNDIEVSLTPMVNLVENIRTVKEAEEQELIMRATDVADLALEYAKSIIAPGIAENEVEWELEKFLREHGSETLPFEIIVASGPNSALPHAKASERVIQSDEPVLIDLGARVKGYCSDLSRTFCCGKGDSEFSKLYDIVLGAQLTALATIEPGMNGDKADKLARTVIEQSNYGDLFGHGLGHGIGLSVHESPRIGPTSSDILCDGMAFTVEPGVYIAGWGGIRIEDTVLMQNGKIKTLSKSDKTAII
jgi:Xaa-Pro aminopeptidase